MRRAGPSRAGLTQLRPAAQTGLWLSPGALRLWALSIPSPNVFFSIENPDSLSAGPKIREVPETPSSLFSPWPHLVPAGRRGTITPAPGRKTQEDGQGSRREKDKLGHVSPLFTHPPHGSTSSELISASRPLALPDHLSLESSSSLLPRFLLLYRS